MTHINYLPDSDGDPADWENFNADDPTTWPNDSYAGRERDLAYFVNDDTMQWYHTMTDYGYDENYNAWALFNMLMMHPAAARAMITDELSDELVDKMIAQIQDDANENSGDYFRVALDTRLTAWKTLQDLAASFRARTTSIDDI